MMINKKIACTAGFD